MFKISVDPGLGGTGYAVWKGKHTWGELNPFEIGVINCRGDKPFEEQVKVIVGLLHKELYWKDVNEVALEWPKLHSGSAKSHMSAVKGDLFKLTYLIGALAQSFSSQKIVLVPVINWRGQLPEPVLKRRIEKLIKEDLSEVTPHEIDAVGIGLYMQGRF